MQRKYLSFLGSFALLTCSLSFLSADEVEVTGDSFQEFSDSLIAKADKASKSSKNNSMEAATTAPSSKYPEATPQQPAPKNGAIDGTTPAPSKPSQPAKTPSSPKG